MWELETVNCDFCGSEKFSTLRNGTDLLHGLEGKFAVVQCSECGLVRTSPRPKLEFLGLAYPQQYDPYSKPPKGRAPKGVLKWSLENFRDYPSDKKSAGLLKILGKLPAAMVLNNRRTLGYIPFTGSGKLLDFGCGSGGYIAKMKAAGWNAQGLDMSDQAVKVGAENGLLIHQGTLPGADIEKESFDAVTMWQAIEHVPSPKQTVRAIFDIVKPGGYFLAACPRFDSLPSKWFTECWFPLDLPRHLTHFTAETLSRVVKDAGFEVCKIHNVRRPSTVRKSLKYLADKNGGRLTRWLSNSRFIVGAMCFYASLFKKNAEMVIIARKPNKPL